MMIDRTDCLRRGCQNLLTNIRNSKIWWLFLKILTVSMLCIETIFYLSFKIKIIRPQFRIKFEICEDLFWSRNIQSSHQRQSSQVCWWDFGHRRDNGTFHRVLHYECRGNCIFWRKDNHTDGQKDTHKEIKSDSKILKCDEHFIFLCLNQNRK